MLLAVLSVVTVQVTGTNHINFHYIPKPSINKWLNWGDRVISVEVNESSWLPNWSLQPQEEGKKCINYTLAVQEIPIYVGQGTYCLSVTFQIYLGIVKLSRIFMVNFICFTHLVLEDRR